MFGAESAADSTAFFAKLPDCVHFVHSMHAQNQTGSPANQSKLFMTCLPPDIPVLQGTSPD